MNDSWSLIFFITLPFLIFCFFCAYMIYLASSFRFFCLSSVLGCSLAAGPDETVLGHFEMAGKKKRKSHITRWCWKYTKPLSFPAMRLSPAFSSDSQISSHVHVSVHVHARRDAQKGTKLSVRTRNTYAGGRCTLHLTHTDAGLYGFSKARKQGCAHWL